ncbi:hypothetical protein ADT28_05525 [Xylella fastidiosa]|nr:membrane protein [Xylella fastidiosa]KXB13393.1 hypothetical protein ADT29_08080 [Xylella fastidiosa]KXB21217.1 hypothetical protein ADT28_05525 [Xylella fastidiosa]NRP69117.1 membrane protein [Xylella fastidiosa]TNW23183.1 hypothetical protein EIP73_10130 [Xylella fastidiosa subsp. pauca]
MNIRELASSEIMQIDGAGWISGLNNWMSDTAQFVNTGTAIGTVGGFIRTGTLVGASRGGFIGAAGGFAAGLGWGVGTLIHDRIIYPYARL